MISSEFKKILSIMLEEYAESILDRPLKQFEITHFFNLYEERIELIINRAKQQLRVQVAQYLEESK